MQNDLKLWKDKFKKEVDDKEFFHKQALDAKRKNKLLKVAIGRMQTEEIEGETKPPMMLGNSQDDPVIKEENLKDNTFLTGANIEEKLDDDAIDNDENAQALVEQNLMNNPSMAHKRRG